MGVKIVPVLGRDICEKMLTFVFSCSLEAASLDFVFSSSRFSHFI